MDRKLKTKPRNKKNTGAPTKYRDDFPEKMIEYFSREPKMDKIGQKELAPRLPTFQICSKQILGVSYDTMQEYRHHYKEFSDAYRLCKELQKEFIIRFGLNGMFNPGFAKFVAVNTTDMRDTVTHAGDSENPLTIEQLVKNKEVKND